MSFSARPLRQDVLQPYLNKSVLFAKISLGWKDSNPYIYCGIVDSVSIPEEKSSKSPVARVAITMRWHVEIRHTTTVKAGSDVRDDVHLDRAIPKTFVFGYTFELSEPYVKDKNGTLRIFNHRDLVEISAAAEPAILVLRVQSEFPDEKIH
jgi:hypothetical protein